MNVITNQSEDVTAKTNANINRFIIMTTSSNNI